MSGNLVDKLVDKLVTPIHLGEANSLHTEAPIGIFDSGVGGLSILQHVRSQLPHEQLLYFADSGYSPYGDKPENIIVERSLTIAAFLLQGGAKALVVACNTATAAAIKALRERYPDVPLVGVEPGLKPAAAISRNKTIGVLATDRTLASTKFKLLREQISAATGVCFHLQACVGLADQIEKGALRTATTEALVQRYLLPLLQKNIDTLILGCTHYPFVQALIEDIIKKNSTQPITIIDTGEPVARQLTRLLSEKNLLRTASNMHQSNQLETFTSGDDILLKTALSTLLQLHPTVIKVA